ncbi:MAG TPA: response regulator, partial [Thermodesulfatator sp.]|nr:response regulator [Thermodesulfatator sp.]
TASGQGTTMTIFLKAIKEIALETKAGGGLVPGRGQEILLVEDEESVLEALKASLEALGYQVTVARDGLEALRIYSKRANEIALVLTDMVMPRMNGLELLENLRRLDPQVRIVLLSGYPLGEDHHFLEGLKKVAWLQKPARIEELSQTIARVLSS